MSFFLLKNIYSYTTYIRVRIIRNKQIMTVETNYKDDDDDDDACARGPLTYEKRAAQNTTQYGAHTDERRQRRINRLCRRATLCCNALLGGFPRPSRARIGRAMLYAGDTIAAHAVPQEVVV